MDTVIGESHVHRVRSDQFNANPQGLRDAVNWLSRLSPPQGSTLRASHDQLGWLRIEVEWVESLPLKKARAKR